jgi:hypothetical protein
VGAAAARERASTTWESGDAGTKCGRRRRGRGQARRGRMAAQAPGGERRRPVRAESRERSWKGGPEERDDAGRMGLGPKRPPRYSRKGRLAGDLPLSGAGSAGSPPFLAASLLQEMIGIRVDLYCFCLLLSTLCPLEKRVESSE